MDNILIKFVVDAKPRVAGSTWGDRTRIWKASRRLTWWATRGQNRFNLDKLKRRHKEPIVQKQWLHKGVQIFECSLCGRRIRLWGPREEEQEPCLEFSLCIRHIDHLTDPWEGGSGVSTLPHQEIGVQHPRSHSQLFKVTLSDFKAQILCTKLPRQHTAINVKRILTVRTFLWKQSVTNARVGQRISDAISKTTYSEASWLISGNFRKPWSLFQVAFAANTPINLWLTTANLYFSARGLRVSKVLWASPHLSSWDSSAGGSR